MLKIEKTVLPSPEQWEIIIESMRNPKNSWDLMDSGDGCLEGICGKCGFNPNWCGIKPEYIIGPKDHRLMDQLNEGGPVHAKYRRMIPVYVTMTAPLYFWKEFDTYKIGTVCNSCSTMHKIDAKEFTLDDFSHEHLFDADTDYNLDKDDMILAVKGYPENNYCKEYWDSIEVLKVTIDALNLYRKRFKECEAKLKRTDLTEAERKHVTAQKKHYWWQMIQLLPSSYNQKRTIMLNYEVLVGIYKWRKGHKLNEWHTFCSWIESLPYSELITGGEV